MRTTYEEDTMTTAIRPTDDQLQAVIGTVQWLTGGNLDPVTGKYDREIDCAAAADAIAVIREVQS
jgi:hypothetical protein